MSMDDKAEALATLEVKRNRTLADLDAVQTARQGVDSRLSEVADMQSHVNASFIRQLEDDTLSEDNRQALYREWGAALLKESSEIEMLTSEHNRLHIQEVVLVRMLTEIERQIEALRAELG